MQMSITDGDYKLIMRTLNENIGAISSPESSKVTATALANEVKNKPGTFFFILDDFQKNCRIKIF